MKLIVILAISSWLVLGMLFPAYPTIQRLKNSGQLRALGWVLLVPMACALILGAVADVVWNAFVGTWVFREIPHEFLFTSRLKRHWRGNDAKQRKRAQIWVDKVNLIDPGHV